MTATAPAGQLPPKDGRLPSSAVDQAGSRPFGLYLHVPFCTARCGYCDFNTYVLGQPGGPGRADYLRACHRELEWAQRCLAASGATVPPLATIFIGGGTPTLLTPGQLGELVADARDRFGLASGAEVTCEANPETITPGVVEGLLEAGVNRLSLGMQSHQMHVLATLDRVHTPGQVMRAVRAAHAAGFASVSLDLIYGAPRESPEDWRSSLEAALACRPEHVSAYALVVEEGTPLARRIAAGELPGTCEDEQADKYLMAEQVLGQAGLASYEISNWALPGHQCRHNLAYWHSDNWWGAGPGAHSHIGGFRWWNHRHPARWIAAAEAGEWPAAACETLSADERHEESVLLELRLAEGLPLDLLSASERARLPALEGDGLVTCGEDGRLRLTLQGRLLADAVIRELLD